MGLPNDGVDTPLPPAAVTLVADDAQGRINTIPNGVERVVISGVTNDGNDWVVLPKTPVLMQSIRGWTVAAHELRTPASSNTKINGQDGDGTKQAAIPATTLWKATYVGADGWVLEIISELGAVVTAIVPD